MLSWLSDMADRTAPETPPLIPNPSPAPPPDLPTMALCSSALNSLSWNERSALGVRGEGHWAWAESGCVCSMATSSRASGGFRRSVPPVRSAWLRERCRSLSFFTASISFFW